MPLHRTTFGDVWTSDTPEWLSMQWQGRALWAMLLGECDESGRIPASRASDVAKLLDMPLDVASVGIVELMRVGWLIDNGDGVLLVPMFACLTGPE